MMDLSKFPIQYSTIRQKCLVRQMLHVQCRFLIVLLITAMKSAGFDSVIHKRRK